MAKLNEVQIIEHLKDAESLLVVCEDGSICRINKNKLIRTTGSEAISSIFKDIGWHRVCIGISNVNMTSAILNVGNNFYSSNPGCACLYFAGSGYSTRKVKVIEKIGTMFPKMRFIYKPSNGNIYIDIYYAVSATNNVYFSISSALNVVFDEVRYIGDAIPDGYSVEEFIL